MLKFDMWKQFRVEKESNTPILMVERDITCWMDITLKRRVGNMPWSLMDVGTMGVPDVFTMIGITYAFRARVFLRDLQKV